MRNSNFWHKILVQGRFLKSLDNLHLLCCFYEIKKRKIFFILFFFFFLSFRFFKIIINIHVWVINSNNSRGLHMNLLSKIRNCDAHKKKFKKDFFFSSKNNKFWNKWEIQTFDTKFLYRDGFLSHLITYTCYVAFMK